MLLRERDGRASVIGRGRKKDEYNRNDNGEHKHTQ